MNNFSVAVAFAGSLLCIAACSAGGTGASNAATLDASSPDAGGASDGASTDGSRVDGAGPAQVPPGAKRIFVTQETFEGNLVSGGGLAGADGACSDAAKAAQLGGSWKAWISTSTVDAIDRISDVGPWFDLGGTEIFSDKANLAQSPAAALWRDENGTSLASDRIWTGTGFGGKYAPDLGPGSKPCSDWTSAAQGESAKIGQVGRKDGAAWTAFAGTTCDQQAHLICLEQ